jgi:hypothetical protein
MDEREKRMNCVRRITIGDYVTGMLNAGFILMPPRKPSCYSALGVLAAASLLLVLACSGKASAQKGFSLSSLKGSYAGTFSGKANTGTQLLPLLGTGVFVSDGAGNLSGHQTYTVSTTVCEAAIKGTYKVNPDGTGTASVHFTSTTPGCKDGSYTQSLVIGNAGALVLLSNTNGDQINEEWHLQ